MSHDPHPPPPDLDVGRLARALRSDAMSHYLAVLSGARVGFLRPGPEAADILAREYTALAYSDCPAPANPTK